LNNYSDRSNVQAGLLLCLLCFSLSLPIKLPAEVIGVRLPSYDSSGRLLWEISASEVRPMDEESYFAVNPSFSILENRQATTTAKSSAGFFDMAENKAKGNEVLEVRGTGFSAYGSPWEFERNDHEKARLSFAEQANIGFDYELAPQFAGLSRNSNQTVADDHALAQKKGQKWVHPSLPDLDEFPTTAWAKSFLLIDQGNGKHQFELKGDAEIKMQMVDKNGSGTQETIITCEQAILNLVNDRNNSQPTDGKILKIEANGNVVVQQPTRTCTAQSIHWHEDGAGLILDGNATVYDSKWGKAEGAKIILRKEDGRAEVVGGEGRSKLSIPMSPKFRFPK
jgi:lipopolysaccharide export system protein LptA